MHTLSIQKLSFSYGKNSVFQSFDMEVSQGVHVLLGPNGAGKSTLFKLLSSILPVKHGLISLDGKYYGKEDMRKYIAYIPQNFDVFPTLRVREFLEYVGEVKYKLKGGALKKEVDKAVMLSDIQDFEQKKIKELSGGMKQRVGIAQAIIGEPVLILADEPTAGLDPEQRARFYNVLDNISEGKIVLLSTHLIEEVEKTDRNILILADGALTFQGSYPQLLKSVEGKFFALSMDISQYDEAAISSRYVIVGKAFEQKMVTLTVAAKEGIPPGEGLTPAQPQLHTIWSYYTNGKCAGDAEARK